MQVNYITTGKGADTYTLWNMKALTQLDLEAAGVKNTCKEIKNKLKTINPDSIDPKRLSYINQLLSYLTGFWFFDNSLKKDKRRIAYVALLELLTPTIDVDKTKLQVMYATQLVRFQHMKRRDYQGQVELIYDIKGTGSLEKALDLTKEADRPFRGYPSTLPKDSPYSYEVLHAFGRELAAEVPGWHESSTHQEITATSYRLDDSDFYSL